MRRSGLQVCLGVALATVVGFWCIFMMSIPYVQAGDSKQTSTPYELPPEVPRHATGVWNGGDWVAPTPVQMIAAVWDVCASTNLRGSLRVHTEASLDSPTVLVDGKRFSLARGACLTMDSGGLPSEGSDYILPNWVQVFLPDGKKGWISTQDHGLTTVFLKQPS